LLVFFWGGRNQAVTILYSLGEPPLPRAIRYKLYEWLATSYPLSSIFMQYIY
jgi:hypothetical protein